MAHPADPDRPIPLERRVQIAYTIIGVLDRHQVFAAVHEWPRLRLLPDGSIVVAVLWRRPPGNTDPDAGCVEIDTAGRRNYVLTKGVGTLRKAVEKAIEAEHLPEV